MEAWESYEGLLETQGLLTDTATGSIIGAVSDSIAQTSEQVGSAGVGGNDVSGGGAATTDSTPQLRALTRALRFAVFGAADGFAGHHWFEALDSAMPRTDVWLTDTLLKVAADSALYTPCWCAVFLFSMALMEGRGVFTAVGELRRDFLDLLRGNYGITLPFVALIYGCVPVRFQVAGFALLTLAYTIIVSLWANARGVSAQSGLPAA